MLDLIFGRRELGKTTLAVSIARNSPTRVIWDVRHMINTTSDIIGDEGIPALYDMLDTRSEIIVRPAFNKDEAFAETCEQIYRWLKDNPDEQFCLLVDEMRFLKQPEKDQYFDFIVRCTKRNLVTTVLTSHAVIDVSTDLRRIADYWLMFKMTLAADLERVAERCGLDCSNAVEKLEPYQFVVWDDSKAKWHRVTTPEKWYVNLEGDSRNGRITVVA